METLTNKQENDLNTTESRVTRRAVLLWHAAAALRRALAFLEVLQQMQHPTICGEYRESAVTKRDRSILQDCNGTAVTCTGLRDKVYN